MSATDGRGGERSPVRRRGVQLAAGLGAVVLLLAALAAWALASPVGSSPDDNFHLANIYCTAGEATCRPEGLREVPCYAGNGKLTADCQRDAGVTVPATNGIRGGWYPPLNYSAMSALVGDTVRMTTLTVRLANSVLSIALLIGSLALSSRRLRPAVALSWLVAAVPLGMFLFASINPNAWSVIGVAACWGPALSFLIGDHRRSEPLREDEPSGAPRDGRASSARWLSATRIAFVALSTLLALGARSESPLFVTGVALAVTLLGFQREHWRRALLPAGMVVAAVAFYLFYGASKLSEMMSYQRDGTVRLWDLTVGVAVLPFRGLGPDGPLSWLDTPLPATVTVSAVGAFAAASIIGLARIDTRKALALLVFLVACQLGGTLAAYQAMSTGNNLQPRYFLPALFVIAGLALIPRQLVAPPSEVGSGPLSPNFTSLQFWLIAGAVIVANSAALLAVLSRFTFGVGPLQPDLLAKVGRPPWWWESIPVGPFGVWLLGSVAFAAAIVVAFRFIPALRWDPQKSQTR
ncbi:MAG: hypothetical protein QG671_2240 [Actinomycetota bacterium]|nr:hypothetical protein [Actinomycetota bacterium]